MSGKTSKTKRAKRRVIRPDPKPKPKKRPAAAQRAPRVGRVKDIPKPWRAGERSSGPEPVELCPTCEEIRPLSEFQHKAGPGTPGVAICAACRKRKKPPRDALALITPRDRRAIKLYLETGSTRDVARMLKISPDRVRELLLGSTRRRDRRAQETRAAFVEYLNGQGLTLPKLARLMELEVQAYEPRWNPAKGTWDYFPDHKARQLAIRWLARLLGGDPPPLKDKDSGPRVNVAFVTNALDREQYEKDKGGATKGRLVIDVPQEEG